MIKIIITVFGIVAIGAAIFFAFKNNNAYNNQVKIMNAIYDYGCEMIESGNGNSMFVTFDDMESYSSTLLRFWDWGYTRILPKDKFEIIKPYIQ